MKKWLFNPFVYIAGSKALLTGWGVMLLTIAISYFSHAHFDGVIDMHAAGRPSPVLFLMMEQVIDWGLMVLVFYPGALLFSRSSTRFIDIAGTMALARWPIVISAIVAFGIAVPDTNSVDALVKSITPMMLALSVVTILAGIWMIALMYNAFRVSSNMKGEKATGVFIGCLFVAEIASYFIYHHLVYKHLI